MKKLARILPLSLSLIVITANVSFADESNGDPRTDVVVDQCGVKGLFYTVQLGVFSKPVSDDVFPASAKPIYCLKREDGKYAYFAGIFDDRFDALLKRYDIVSKGGLYEAYVTAYYNGVQINITEADNLLAEHGSDILYNSDKSEFYTEKIDN